MPRILALDYGTKRVGMAVTDPLQLIATALDTVHSKDVIAFLKNYLLTEPVEAFVVGMPKRLDNTATNNTPHVVGFLRTLQKTFPLVPVHAHDERFTSVLAARAMLAGGLSKKARRDKATVDKVSATIILQSYLASQSAPA